MTMEIKLDAFEGPLDLLLHLIEKNKVDIYDIPIALITSQYMEYLEAMREADLDVMSEFLVMAATLLDIKCKMLLPKKVNEEGEAEDPRDELVGQLLEYKLCRYMSFALKDMQQDASHVLFRKAEMPEWISEYKAPVDYDVLLGDMTLEKLNKIFKETLKRREDKIDPIRSKFGKIEKDEVNLEERTEFVKKYALEHKSFGFRDLLEGVKTKLEVIVTFMCLLELMKTGNYEVEQESDDEDIYVKLKEKAA
ncbi:MAG: segregation/condensation protein A [Lachnospiraceae bacterium]|nr:segregation/condensation protein A [Lachnospiraceae bacterium]MDN4742398.1 segregation/condensation protein A [Lachnospiraceae bacterium C1.1]